MFPVLSLLSFQILGKVYNKQKKNIFYFFTIKKVNLLLLTAKINSQSDIQFEA